MSRHDDQIFTADELRRYGRQLDMPGFGLEAQAKLRGARVAVVGAGALGSAAIYYLAAAGIGSLTIIDGDVVDMSNLQRQIIHSTVDIGRPKALSATEKVEALNPSVAVRCVTSMFTPDNAAELIGDADFVIDATDNFAARYAVNDACVALSIPYCHGSVWRYQGQVTTWVKGSACYRCLYPSAPATSAVSGPIAMAPGVIGTIQATEALKAITGIGQPLTNKLLTVDLLTMTFATFELKPQPDCPTCSASAQYTDHS